MKYMCEYTIRTAGLSFDQNIAGGESWPRLSEQNLRVDKWSVCRG